jgi:hypothetical protein
MLETRIANLDDSQAIEVLTLVADHEYPGSLTSGAAEWADVEPRLREALADPELEPFVATATTFVGDGGLARATLAYAATSATLAEVVDKAIDYVEGPRERLAVPVVAVGVLVLVLLQTEVKLERQSNGRWRFLFHKKPLSDAALARVLTTLISRFTNRQL